MNYPTPTVFAGFVLAKWTNDGYKPGRCVRVNPAAVRYFMPETDGYDVEQGDRTQIWFGADDHISVMASYEEVARRLVEAYECPGV